MPDRRISQLPEAASLDGSELVPIVQGGVTSRTTTAGIAALASGGGGGNTKQAYCVVNSNGDFVIGSHPGIDSVTWDCGNPGLYQINFTSGYFSDTPAVALSMFQGNPHAAYEIVDYDPSFVVVQIYDVANPGTPMDMPFMVTAIGVFAL